MYFIMFCAEKGVPDFWLTALKTNEVLSDEVLTYNNANFLVKIKHFCFTGLPKSVVKYTSPCSGVQILDDDEGALKYLKDIKWFRIDNPKGFKLEFYFAPNPYFKNAILTKTYHMIDDDEPVLEKAIG